MRRVTLVLWVACSAAPSCYTRPPLRTSACAVRWSSAQPLRAAGRLAYVEAPEIVRSGQSILLVGAPTAAQDSSGIPLLRPSADSLTPHFAGAEFKLTPDGLSEGRLVSLPENTWRMSEPRVLLTRHGEMAVLWMVPPVDWGTGKADFTIWGAVLRDTALGPAELVVPGSELLTWNRAGVSAAVAIGGAPQVAVPTSLVRGDTLYILRRERSRWGIRKVPFPFHVYPQIAAVTNDSDDFVISYAADGNTLFVRRARGGSWDAAIQVSDSSAGRVHYPQLLRSRTGMLVLIWIELRRGHRNSTIAIASSVDKGTSWSLGPTHQVPGTILDISSVVDSGGHVHTVFRVSGSDRDASPGHLLWHEGTWIESSPPTTEGPVMDRPVLTALSRDSVLAIWGTAPPGRSLPITVYTVGRLRCDH